MVPPSASPSVQQPQNPQVAQGTAPQTSENGEKPKPMQFHSLAEGVQAKGLADLLKEAEDQMKAGHYNSALEQYELAEQVAPNNPLILLGRANAELGQSYYTRSDTHLRQAFSGDHALLMGQYDLNALLGQDRLQFLVQDLKAIAKSEPKESRPLFLLAYIAYNTNNERKAAAYLDLAEKRAGGKDAVYDVVRKYWSLPSDAGQNPNDVLTK
jgi:cytochrome c-type biogenesis protein CcmH/NrfG